MYTVAATEFSKNVGKHLDVARHEPVMIQKQGRDSAVLVSAEDYERMRQAAVKVFHAVADAIGAEAKKRGLTARKLEELLADE